MSGQARRHRAVDVWAAAAVPVLGAAYVGVGLVWLVSEQRGDLRDALTPVDPYLAVLEVLLVLVAPCMIVTMASVHRRADRETKSCSLAAFGFMILAAGMTASLHFVQLTVVRHLGPQAAAALAPVTSIPWRWPSVAFALDLLAWDLFLGLSMLCAAPVFAGDGLETWVRRAMRLTGGLCLAGLLGPATGDLRLQYFGIAGYAAAFPVTCLLLAIHFRRSEEKVKAEGREGSGL